MTYQSGGFITSPEQFVGTDSDGDGISDLVELYGLKPNGDPIGTDPYSNDTDGDGSNFTHIDFDTYVLYMSFISDYFTIYGKPVGGIPAIGLLGNLESGINTISQANNMGITATWESGTDSERTFKKIKKMIVDDIPAVFASSISFADELQLYRLVDHQFTTDGGQTVKGHYMVITGIIEYSDDIENIIGRKHMLRIATYGKEYYVDYDEYAEQLSSVDTNIMYIEK